MNVEGKNAILNIISQFSNIFYIDNDNLIFNNNVKHNIRTTDEIPVYTKSYRYPNIHKTDVQKQIQKMLDQKCIHPPQFPWSSPIWIVPMTLDAWGVLKWLIVVDYRKLNKKTIEDKYPPPNIPELLDKLERSHNFTSSDLGSESHQIEMAEDDSPKIAFNTENVHVEFLRMPFGWIIFYAEF